MACGRRRVRRNRGGIVLTVADMNRLEQAARVSMSGFQDAEAPPSTSARATHPVLLLVAVALVAAIALTLATQFN